MGEIIITSAGLKLALAAAAFAAAWWSLRLFDRRQDFDFKHWLETADEQGRGIYFGFRILAICILFGLIIS